MARPISSFQEQRAALMGSSNLDPNLANSISSGIAALSANADAAARSFANVRSPEPVATQITPEAIARLDPQVAEQYLSQMPNSGPNQSILSNEGMSALSNFGSRSANSATGSTPASGSMNSGEGGTFAQLLHRTEGGGNYDTLFAHAQREGGRFAGVKPSQMTIGEVLQFQNPNGPYAQFVKQELARQGQTPRIATPIGAGQIVGTTLRNASKSLGLSPNTPFNAATQDTIINHLAQQRLRGASNINQARAGLRSEWEGFKNVSNIQLDQAIRQLGFNF